MSEDQPTPPSLVEDLKAAPRDRRVVGALIAAVGAGVLFGLILKPTLGDKPPAERGVSTGSAVAARLTDTDGLDIVVNTRRSDEGRLPTSTTLLDAPIQGVPALAQAPRMPTIRVNAPAPVDPDGPLMPLTSASRQGERIDTRGCRDAGSYAEEMVCGEPRLAAADRRQRQAYDRALEAGVRPQRLARQQDRWLDARDDAAREDPRAVAEVYEARIAELEDMAAYAD
ncbi:MAG: hypothetical protein V4466_14945 [Pseudomonadota bacterium]